MSGRDWSREPYRKLFLRPSPEFRSLPVLVQGLAYVLMREAEDDGSFRGDADLDKALAKIIRTCGVHPRERKLVVDRLQELLADGFIVHEDGSIVVRNLASMNERRDFGDAFGRNRARPERASTRPERSSKGSESSSYGARNVSSESRTVPDAPDPVVVAPDTSVDAPDPVVESAPTSRNHSPESATRAGARAQDQVGSQVDQSSTTGPRRETPPESIEGDLVTLLTSASVFAEEDPTRVARSARLLAERSPRSEFEAREAAELACTATLRALGGREGIAEGKIGSYFLRTLEGLLAKGGLEAAQQGLAPRAPQPQGRRAHNDPGAPIDWAAVDANRPRRARGGS